MGGTPMTTERVDLTIARALTDWRSKRPYDRSGVMASRGFHGGWDAARHHYINHPEELTGEPNA